MALTNIYTSTPLDLVALNQATSAFDAFGRLRISNPLTLFDSKLLNDKRPLLWDEATVSGSGFTSTFLPNESSVLIESDGTVGKFVRQTFQRFNYQPGKSQFIAMTGVLEPDNIDGTLEIVKRSSVTGSPVDTTITESDLNSYLEDIKFRKSDNIKVDFSKSQIFGVDIEWLGVGQVRYSLTIGGDIFYVHALKNANVNDSVYMTTPNLPLRYEVEVTADATYKKIGYFDDDNGIFFQYKIDSQTATSLKCICSTVISEGGQEATGITRYASTGGTPLEANTVGTIYAALGIKQKSTYKDVVVNILNQSLYITTADSLEWMLILNPTVAGTFTYADQTNSAVQIAKGVTANTITGGTILAGGFATQDQPMTSLAPSSLRLGSSIDGTMDEIVLCVRPLSVNLDVEASLTWRELL